MRWFFLGFFLIAILVIVRLSVYTVDASEYAYVTILGRHVETFDGGQGGAGFHVGWPWPFETVQRLDRRLQQLDLAATEHLMPDAEGKTIDKTLTVEAYVVWRVADGQAVDRFVRRIGTLERAKTILSSRVISQLGASLGQMKMNDMISTEPGRVDRRMEDWQQNFLKQLRPAILDEYGIELADIRLRRFNYQGDVRQAIFERIRSERRKKVTEYISEGDREAKNIETRAEENYRTKLAEARFEEERLKGQADAEAIQIRNQAHSRDPEFYSFLKQMEKLGSLLGDNKTVLLMSTHRPFFELLFQPPRVEKK